MNFNQFHFIHPHLLWSLILLLIIWIIYFAFFCSKKLSKNLENFIDSHLIPYLLVANPKKRKKSFKRLLVFSLVWSGLTLALAGPSWKDREVEIFSEDQSLIVLLDLSESMNTKDIKPSRLIRAKQKIEDLINLAQNVKIGLIAFAADAHMIIPLTEDKETIRYLLPTLDTDLVYVQGSRLSSALEMAYSMLEHEPGSNKAILIISDGDLEDGSAINIAKKIADKGAVIHALGLGTSQGAFLEDSKGNMIKKNGSPVISKLEKTRLVEMTKMGKGQYFEGNYLNQAETTILRDLKNRIEVIDKGKKFTIQEELFYWFILPIIPFILFWFRRGAILFMVLIIPTMQVEAFIDHAYFLNSEQQGKEAFNAGNYEKAIDVFKDPYRKGVAYYKAGNYLEAEKMFQQSSRLDISTNAEYNLGNALAQQQKFQEAISAYENVLNKNPDHHQAKDNLELIKKILEQKDKESSESEKENQEDNHQKDEEKKSEDSSKNSKSSKENDSEKKSPSSPNSNQQNSQNDSKSDQDVSSQNEQQIKENEKQKNEQPSSEKEKNGEKEQQLNQAKSSQESQEKKINSEDNLLEEKRSEKENEDEKLKNYSEDKDNPAHPLERHGDNNELSEADQQANFWLNRLSNDPKNFMKNKFYIESKLHKTTGGVDPW